jgi:hypothetical protein
MYLNIFLTQPNANLLSALSELRERIGCITLPYGCCPDELADFPQALLCTDSRLPPDWRQKHPHAQAVFSFTPLQTEVPNILCTPDPCDAPFVCFSLPPPDADSFIPQGMTRHRTESLRRALIGRNPETVTVELYLGAYAAPFPYGGSYRTLPLSEALSVARREGTVMNMNKNHYYSYFIHRNETENEVVFFLRREGFFQAVKELKALGIRRFAISAEEAADEAVRPLLSIFEKSS